MFRPVGIPFSVAWRGGFLDLGMTHCFWQGIASQGQSVRMNFLEKL
jgi:hypothetical protein